MGKKQCAGSLALWQVWHSNFRTSTITEARPEHLLVKIIIKVSMEVLFISKSESNVCLLLFEPVIAMCECVPTSVCPNTHTYTSLLQA